MILLPPLIDKTKERPHRPDFEETYLIPDTDHYPKFWKHVYLYLQELEVHSPVRHDIQRYINSAFGYFGYRAHPVTHEPRYFHVGLSLDLESGRDIYPVLPGILEHAGYGAVNGHYVLLSHPEMETEDGYVLHTMYCHLKKPLVQFTSYQKMLRKISLNSHPLIPIAMDQVLGRASTTGLSRDNHPGLYLQFSFRKFDHPTIVIDPMQVYYGISPKNETADITNQKIIRELFS